jgi:hypothetical protein
MSRADAYRRRARKGFGYDGDRYLLLNKIAARITGVHPSMLTPAIPTFENSPVGSIATEATNLLGNISGCGNMGLRVAQT